jgi:hypothetical protein
MLTLIPPTPQHRNAPLPRTRCQPRRSPGGTTEPSIPRTTPLDSRCRVFPSLATLSISSGIIEDNVRTVVKILTWQLNDGDNQNHLDGNAGDCWDPGANPAQIIDQDVFESGSCRPRPGTRQLERRSHPSRHSL